MVASPKEIFWDKYKSPLISPEIENEEDDDEYEKKISKTNHQLGPCIVGPMGVIPVGEHNLPGKNFNFWMFYTNFNIDANVVNILDNLPGVETLDIFTRYRGRIGIGKLFEEDEVKENVEKALGVKNV